MGARKSTWFNINWKYRLKFIALYVAKGFNQTEWFVYSNTFAPKSKTEIFENLLGLLAIENFFLKRTDVKAFFAS